MLELISLVLPTLARLFRRRHELVVENLLLRHQLNVALRSRPRPDLKSRDRFFWLVVRSLYPDWKQHLILVHPETVVRWHRQRLAALLALALRPSAGPAPIEP